MSYTFKFEEQDEGGELKKDNRGFYIDMGADKLYVDRDLNTQSGSLNLADLVGTFVDRYRTVTIEKSGLQFVVGMEIPDEFDEEWFLFEKKSRGSNAKNTEKQKKESAADRKIIDAHRLKRPAIAPYNFIPLNEQIVQVKAGGHHGNFDPNARSGYLDVTLTNRTPFFIRKTKDEAQFFSMQSGKPFVPGSSLRGMTRNLVEIVSWSAMGEGLFSNKHLSYREMADMSGRLRNAYRTEVPYNCKEESDLKEIKAGYLRYDSDKRLWYVVPAGSPSRFDTEDSRKHPKKSGQGYQIFSGPIPKKKKQWLINGPMEGRMLEISETATKAYRDDATRDTKANGKPLDLLKETKENGKHWPKGYPIFYNTAPDNDQLVVSFGHTPYYRVPYARTIADHIPQTPLAAEEGLLDFATAVFGSTEMAGRVWFEDLKAKTFTPWKREVKTRKLLGPKPTTFQHYLEQPDGIATKLDDLRHWGDGTDTDPAPIRGYKQYWHRATPFENTKANHWEATVDEKEESGGTAQTALRPLEKGAVFKGRIHFDNLSDQELGALLFALDLPQNCCHKLGLGKPLGLGSVRLDIDLTLIDRSKRYGKLFSADKTQWNTAEQPGADRAPFKEAFAAEIIRQLKLPVQDLWQSERLRELHAMLDFDAGRISSAKWLEETRYMEIMRPNNPFVGGKSDNEYKNRPVLPTPTDVSTNHLIRQKQQQNHGHKK